MSQHSSKALDDSWIVNDTDDGDISWAGESTPSDSQEENFIPQPLRPSPRVSQFQTPQKPTKSTVPISPDPEFIMPSIGEMSGQPRQRVAARKYSSTPARESKSRTFGARGTPARHQPVPQEDQDPIGRALNMAGSSLMWVLGLVGQALNYLKTPLSILLACYMILVCVQLAQNALTNSIYNALSPLCRIPGASLLNLPMCQPFNGKENYPKLSAGGEMPDPEFDALMKAQSHFETIMSDTAGSASLPMDMKRSEISIRDLRQLVRYSQIPSRHELMHELDGFVETARIASYDLQKFDSHVGRSVDIVLSTNKWTRRVLDDIDLQQSERGLLPAFVSETLLAPFKPVKFTESRLLDQYIQHSHIVSGEIEKLIEEAQALLQVLQNLEDRLDVMHSISARDNIQIQGSKDEVLKELWSYIGLNKAKLGKHDHQLQLLGTVAGYRRRALIHVASTLVHLQSMGTELEELRDRVASPAMMQEAGIKHVPLSVHIENIQLGVERLEIGRERAKEQQHMQTRRILDKSEGAAREEIKYISSG